MRRSFCQNLQKRQLSRQANACLQREASLSSFSLEPSFVQQSAVAYFYPTINENWRDTNFVKVEKVVYPKICLFLIVLGSVGVCQPSRMRFSAKR